MSESNAERPADLTAPEAPAVEVPPTPEEVEAEAVAPSVAPEAPASGEADSEPAPDAEAASPSSDPPVPPTPMPEAGDVAELEIDDDAETEQPQSPVPVDAPAAPSPIEPTAPALEVSEATPAAAPEGQPAPDAEEGAESPDEPDDGRKWYVIHCYSGYENKVRHNLEQRIETMGMKDKIFDVVVPTEEEIEVKDGKRRTVERRVFPGYILVQMLLNEDSWYVVRNTPGVTGFVGMGNEPTPLRPEEVAQIVRRMEADAPRVKVTYKTGQRVRITDGPFNDFIGTVAEIDMDRAKVRVMVSFFGRETPVELDFLQVEKA